MKPEDVSKIKKGAKVTFKGGQGTIKNVYLSVGGIVLQVQTFPGAVVCSNVPVASVDNIEE
jgi:hypothetical protein